MLLGQYPLLCAVQAEFISLVEFLLHGAHRGWPDYSTVKVAIGKKNLKLVKMIIEDEDLSVIRRDGISVKHFLLDAAIECDARDIVKYLMEEHGCIPLFKDLRKRTGEYSLCIATAIAYSASYCVSSSTHSDNNS